MEFGSHSEWGAQPYPKDKRDRYEEVLHEIAVYLEKLSGQKFTVGAVRQQVAFGGTQQEAPIGASHARQWIMNKAVALEMGFIQASDLPVELLAIAGNKPS